MQLSQEFLETILAEFNILHGSTNPVSTLSSSVASFHQQKSSSIGLLQKYPSIRKNGAYIRNQENMTPAEIVAHGLIAAQKIIEEREKG